MDVSSWLDWAESYEPTLSDIPLTPTVPGILTDSYNQAVDLTEALQGYMSANNYERLAYKYALHILIVGSGRSNIPQLKNLYNFYDVDSFAGIVSSAGDGSTNASKLIPTGLQNGSAGTILLWSTPYGQDVESTFEDLKSIGITI